MTNKVITLSMDKTVQVGGIMKKVRVETSNRDVSYVDMVKWANLALEDDVITGREGVSIEVNVTPASAAPVFTPVDEDQRVDANSARPKGVSYGQITKAEEVRKQAEAERRHIEAREDRVSTFRANVRRSVIGYEMTAEGFSKALEAAICNAANHFRALLDEMSRNMAKLNAEKANLHKQVDDAVCSMQKQAEDFNKQADIHAQTVDKVISTRREVEKELEEANRKIKRMKDYAVRLNSVC